jgi:hypothetical protein
LIPDASLMRVRARLYAARNCASVAYGIAPLLLLLFLSVELGRRPPALDWGRKSPC